MREDHNDTPFVKFSC